MRAGIFDPYLDILGGGERYMMSVAECLIKNGWEVDVFWNDRQLMKQKLEERFKLSLGKVNFVQNIFALKTNLIQRWRLTHKYDFIFYLSDGSLPFLFAKKNVIHFQIPFHSGQRRGFLNKLKFQKISKVICNSKFTKKFVDREYGIESSVVYPPVAIGEFEPGKKKNIILSVSRFSQVLHAKKQEVLLEAFRELRRKGLKNWKLILAGGLGKRGEGYLGWLRRKAKHLPVEFYVNVPFGKLKTLYAEAKIFWHAAGFEENEKLYPERMEHFGIVVVEAMAAGCVPVVIGKGGIPEIVDHRINGFLWQTKRDLVRQTLQLIKSPGLMRKISLQSIKDSRKFSKDVFCRKIYEVVEN